MNVPRETIAMRTSNDNAFSALLDRFDLFPSQQLQLRRYVELLETWNQRINLVSGRDVDLIVARHLVDSLELTTLNCLPENGRIMDLGSGAGFPGIPLAIARPSLEIVLVEAVRKKALFLEEVKHVLNLNRVKVYIGRVEAMNSAEEESRFAVIVARAVAPLVKLWCWAEPLLKTNGFLLAMKGTHVQSEIEELCSEYSVICGCV
ncbi:MAG: 16S rRNA (guanine(527)-N(7))-methyltransferase RsmG, partial [Calditrichaeota bacterium]